MATFNISNLTDRLNQIINENTGLNNIFGKNDIALQKLLGSISNGQTILGKVLSVTEDSFQISTNDNVIINAKAESGVTVEKGSTVLFEVNKSSDNKVSLRPLYQNTSNAETAQVALKQAGLPINARSLEMTARHMEYGNSIDRNSLLNSFKDVMTFESAPVKYIVDLQQMQIPVTSENLLQYEAYMNMENSITEGISNIVDSLVNNITDIFENNIANISDIENKVTGEFLNSDKNVNYNSLIETGASLNNDSLVQNQNESASTPNSSIEVSNGALANNELANLGFIDTEALGVTFEQSGVINGIQSLDAFSQIIGLLNENEIPELNYSLNDVFEISNMLTEAGIDAKSIDLSSLADKDTFSPNEIAKKIFEDIKYSITNKLAEKESPESSNKTAIDLVKVLNEPLVKEVINRAFSSQWVLNKEKISDKKEINDLYVRMLGQSKDILAVIHDSGLRNTSTNNLIQNMNSNIDFMEQLNQYVPYVQIPFRSDNQNHNSELYVLKNKKSFTGSDSELSAFLHLDFEALGPTDVLIKLKDKNVSTKFTMASDEALKLVEENIGHLNKRLEDKGYSFKFESNVDNDSKAPIYKMLSNNEGHIIYAKNSFDARV